MSEESEPKILRRLCPDCAEAIRLSAKVCPFCQSKLTRGARWALEYAPVLPTIMALVLAGWVLSLALAEELREGGLNFARHREELLVQRVAIEPVKRGFWLSGFVTNAGNRAWSVKELEVRFSGVNGELMDVQHSKIREPFVVEPGFEHAFRVELDPFVSTNSHAAPEVRVQVATNGRPSPLSD